MNKEFKVRTAPIIANKKNNLFKLHKDDSIVWNEAKMRRENDYKPWEIKYGSGRTAKRFKAVKEGGVNENASYFVFYKANDQSDTYEVCPVDDWYSVSATQRYKTLTAEEAEQKFEQRNKILNHFTVMHSKKGENGDDAGGSGYDKKSFKLSEMDDWDNSGDDENSDGDDEDGDDEKKKKLRKKKGFKKEKDDPDNAPEEGKEDSDEGDFEQREVDYMSDSSSLSSDEEESKEDKNDVKGIAEEEALRELLSTDDEEAENPQQKTKTSDVKTSLGTVDIKQEGDEDSSDSLDSDDYDCDEDKMDTMLMEKGLPTQLNLSKQEKVDPFNTSKQAGTSANQPSTSGANNSVTNKGNKRKMIEPSTTVTPSQQPQPKRPCMNETPSSSQPVNSREKIVEDLIIKYLSRKPMALKSLLKEIKSKLKRMMGATPDLDSGLVETIAATFKRLNPIKQSINGITYFSLRH